MEKQLNILLVEDQRLMAEALKSLLETQADLKVVAIACSEQEALRCCNDLAEIDLILIDIHLSDDGPNGLVLAEQIKTDFKKMKILVISMFDDPPYIRRAKQVGANGFISKNAAGIEIVRAIREVRNGKDIWPPDGDIGPEKGPTPSELEVLKYIERGLTTAQIGIELAISEATVSVFRSHIKQKNNLQTQNDLFKFAETCMRLYGVPPDPIFSEELKKFCSKLKENKEKSDIDVEYIAKYVGEKENLRNRVTRALMRVMDEAWGSVKGRRSVKSVHIELEQDSSKLIFTIRNNGRDEDAPVMTSHRKQSIDALNGILENIRGKLLSSDNNSMVAVLHGHTQEPPPR
jgi:DNA-binding NarL/FixJ family response regulator